VIPDPIPRETLLVRTLVELADTLVADFDVVDLLTLLAARTVEVLDMTAAGLMLAAPDSSLRAMASSSEAMRVLELFEIQADEGPCFDCYKTGLPVVNEHLAPDGGRWPRFGAEALAAGFHTVHALPMRLRGNVIGALNMFQAEAGQIRPADIDAAQALADVATIAILQHRAALEARTLSDQLNEALNSRIVIEQAKGVVAEREALDMVESFARLRTHARNNNLRLADVARGVVDGSLDISTLDRLPKP